MKWHHLMRQCPYFDENGKVIVHEIVNLRLENDCKCHQSIAIGVHYLHTYIAVKPHSQILCQQNGVVNFWVLTHILMTRKGLQISSIYSYRYLATICIHNFRLILSS